MQGSDLTIGWASREQLAEADREASLGEWLELTRAEPDVGVLPPAKLVAGTQGGFLTAVLGEARSHLGVPYLWGGATPDGYDCSGFVQRVFSTAAGVVMPKHTGDQRHIGMRVPASQRAAGDLLFASPKARNIGHVMLLTSADTVLHASWADQRVIEEPISRNAERYIQRGVRRPVLL